MEDSAHSWDMTGTQENFVLRKCDFVFLLLIIIVIL